MHLERPQEGPESSTCGSFTLRLTGIPAMRAVYTKFKAAAALPSTTIWPLWWIIKLLVLSQISNPAKAHLLLWVKRAFYNKEAVLQRLVFYNHGYFPLPASTRNQICSSICLRYIKPWAKTYEIMYPLITRNLQNMKKHSDGLTALPSWHNTSSTIPSECLIHVRVRTEIHDTKLANSLCLCVLKTSSRLNRL